MHAHPSCMAPYNVACGGIFSHAHAVSKTPSEHLSVRILHSTAALEKLIHLEDANLAPGRLDPDSVSINVGGRASRHEQKIWVLLWNQQGARLMSILVHARDDGLGISHRAFLCVVIIGIDIGRGRGKNRLAIRRDFDAVVQLRLRVSAQDGPLFFSFFFGIWEAKATREGVIT